MRCKQELPFVIWDSIDHLMKTDQVKFVISQSWQQASNVLSWEAIEDMAH